MKSPRVYIRDSGIVHALLDLDTWDDVLGHPVAGKSWEGLVVAPLIRAASDRTRDSFYRTATGVEIDLVLELPGGAVWAVDIKRGIATAPARSLRVALDDVKPDRAFVVYGGNERYPLPGDVEAVGLGGMMENLLPIGESP